MDRRIITVVVSILVVILAVFVYLNRNNSQDKILSYKDAQVVFRQAGVTRKIMTLAEIMALGEEEIEAVLDTSKSEPATYHYTGILLRKALASAGVDYSQCKDVFASAVDGYVSVIPISKVLEDDNVYLVYKWEGKPLGTREENGKGPFMIIIRKDQFSQSWCKYLTEVNCE